MTIIKSITHALKIRGYSQMLVYGIRILIGILEISTILSLFNFFDAKIYNEYEFLYGFFSTVFYILFFIFLSWYIKVSANDQSLKQRIKSLNIVQWISFSTSIALIYLSSKLNTFIWPEAIVEKVLYLFNGIWPKIFVPNLSFIIITILIFYAATILKRNRDLKQENDLTI